MNMLSKGERGARYPSSDPSELTGWDEAESVSFMSELEGRLSGVTSSDGSVIFTLFNVISLVNE